MKTGTHQDFNLANKDTLRQLNGVHVSLLAGTGLPAAWPEAAQRLSYGHRLHSYQPLQKTTQKLGFVFWQIQRKTNRLPAAV